METIDPYKVLNVSPDFTLEELKNSFKQLAVKYHSNANTIDMIKKCYMQLIVDYKARSKSSAPPVQIPDDRKFNIHRFNQVFEQNKVEDSYETLGYEEWINSHPAEEYKGGGAIVNKKEPQPLQMEIHGLGGTSFYELGMDGVSDFSGNTESSLNFMDYRLAHSTSKLVDEKYVKMPNYKTMKEIEAERSSMSYNLTEKDLARMAKEKQIAESRERQRDMNIKRMDAMYEQHYNNVSRMMMGTR